MKNFKVKRGGNLVARLKKLIKKNNFKFLSLL